jgi:hypothetical protein
MGYGRSCEAIVFMCRDKVVPLKSLAPPVIAITTAELNEAIDSLIAAKSV